MASVTKENIGNLHDKLVVRVSKEDYFPAFEKSLKEYRKKASMPGFRPGMVPMGMIKKMYGASIFYDEVIRSVEKELQEYLRNENPDFFAQPLPMQNDMKMPDMNKPEDYEFPFELGLKPEVSLDALDNADLVRYQVTVTDEMVREEISRLQKKNGELKEIDAVSAKDNVINVSFDETDPEGNLVESGISKEDNSILIEYFTEEYQEKLQGEKAEDFEILQLNTAFPEKEREWIFADLGLKMEEEEAGNKFFKMTIKKVSAIEEKNLDGYFFKLVFPGKDIQDEETFEKILKEEIQKQWDAVSRNQLQDQIYHKLIETPLEFPEAFLKRWLERGTDKVKSKEEVEAEYPKFIDQLKWTLFSDKIIGDNALEVSEDELRTGMKNNLLSQFGQMNLGEDVSWLDSYIDQMMKDEKHVDNTYRRMITEKLFEWLEAQVTPVEKSVSVEEFTAMQKEHTH